MKQLLRTAVLAVAGLLALAPAALAGSSTQTLTFKTTRSVSERGKDDSGTTGLSKGDTYVQNDLIQDAAKKTVGKYHIACTITDEEDGDSAWSVCTTVSNVKGKGTLVASGLAELKEIHNAPGGFGVAPPKVDFPIVGGTGDYANARGLLTSTRGSKGSTLRYRFTTS